MHVHKRIIIIPAIFERGLWSCCLGPNRKYSFKNNSYFTEAFSPINAFFGYQAHCAPLFVEIFLSFLF